MSLGLKLLCLTSGFVVFEHKLISKSNNNSTENKITNKLDDAFFKEIKLLENKKKYFEIIEICTNILSRWNIEYYNEIDILIILGNAYFASGNNRKSIDVYRTILNKYGNFEGMNEVLYNLCSAIHKIMPKNPDVDLENCRKMVNYGNYALAKITNIDYSKNIKLMINEAKELIEEKDFNDIKFYYENKLYEPALYCCNKFLETYDDDKYYNLVISYKLNTLQKLIENIIKALRIEDRNITHYVFEEMYKKMKKYYREINNIYKETYHDLRDKAKTLSEKIGKDI